MKPPKITNRDMYKRFYVDPEESDKQTPMFDRLNSCLKKRKQFLTKAEASEFATRMSFKTRENYVSYQCRWCKVFHIGHQIEHADALPQTS